MVKVWCGRKANVLFGSGVQGGLRLLGWKMCCDSHNCFCTRHVWRFQWGGSAYRIGWKTPVIGGCRGLSGWRVRAKAGGRRGVGNG